MRSTEQQSREQLEEIAATWIAKRDTGPWTEVDDAELTAWLAESTGHRAAYYRLNAAWQEAGRLQALLHTGPAELAERVIETFSDESDERAATTTYFREVLGGDPHPPTSWVPPSPVQGEGFVSRSRVRTRRERVRNCRVAFVSRVSQRNRAKLLPTSAAAQGTIAARSPRRWICRWRLAGTAEATPGVSCGLGCGEAPAPWKEFGS